MCWRGVCGPLLRASHPQACLAVLSAVSPHRSCEPRRLPLHPLAWPQFTCSIPSTPPCGCFSHCLLHPPHSQPSSETACRGAPYTSGRRADAGSVGYGPGWTRPACKARPWGAPSRAGRQDGLPAELCPMSPVACGCRPSTRWGLPLPIRRAPRSGAAWVLEDWRLWGSADAAWAARWARFPLSPCPKAAGPSSGLAPLRTGTSLLPRGCRLHPVL